MLVEVVKLILTFFMLLASVLVFVWLYDIRIRRLVKKYEDREAELMKKLCEVVNSMMSGFKAEVEAGRSMFRMELAEERRESHANYEKMVAKHANVQDTTLKLFDRVKAWKTPPDSERPKLPDLERTKP